MKDHEIKSALVRAAAHPKQERILKAIAELTGLTVRMAEKNPQKQS